MKRLNKFLAIFSLSSIVSNQALTSSIAIDENVKNQSINIVQSSKINPCDFTTPSNLPDCIVNQILDFVRSVDFKNTYLVNKSFKRVMDQPSFWYEQSRSRDFILSHEKFNLLIDYKKVLTFGLNQSFHAMAKFKHLHMNASGNMFVGLLKRTQRSSFRPAVYNIINGRTYPIGGENLVDPLDVHTINRSGNTLWGSVESKESCKYHFSVPVKINGEIGGFKFIADGKKILNKIKSEFHKRFYEQYPGNYQINFLSQDGRTMVGEIYDSTYDSYELFISILNDSGLYEITCLLKKYLNCDSIIIDDLSSDGKKILFSGVKRPNNLENVPNKIIPYTANVCHLDNNGRPENMYSLGILDGSNYTEGYNFSYNGDSIIGIAYNKMNQCNIFKSTFNDITQLYDQVEFLFEIPGTERTKINAVSPNHHVVAFTSGFATYQSTNIYVWTKDLGIKKIIDLFSDRIYKNFDLNQHSIQNISKISSNGSTITFNLKNEIMFNFPIIAVLPQLLQR